MGIAALSVVLAAVFAWAMVSKRLAIVSTPIFFVTLGLALSQVGGSLHLEPDPHSVKVLAEVTLVWVLFADASRIRLPQVRRDVGAYVRLLGVGLPLSIAAGAGLAIWLLDLDPWYALLVGAALAPTDAALGAAVMTDRRVPTRIRQLLNVESGLNDGIATPVVMVAVAAIAAQEGLEGSHGAGRALVGLLVGVAVGILVGGGGAALLGRARRRGWTTATLIGPGVLALALLTYTAAVLVEGNGFVAAFVGGGAFGALGGGGDVDGESGGTDDAGLEFVEQACSVASTLAWLVFGAVAVPMLGERLSWELVLYAVSSLTLVRMLPVAVSMLGTGTDRATVAFVGWFGPRGLASIVFALIALEELHGMVDDVVSAIGVTVLLSVVAHGLSARPLATRYARTVADDLPEEHAEPRVRRY